MAAATGESCAGDDVLNGGDGDDYLIGDDNYCYLLGGNALVGDDGTCAGDDTLNGNCRRRLPDRRRQLLPSTPTKRSRRS